MLDSNKIICYYSSNWENNFILSIINTSNYELQEKIITYPYKSSKRRSYTLSCQPYVILNHSIKYIKPYSNTIYRYANQKSIPYLFIENKKEISKKLLQNRLNEADGDYYKTNRHLLEENIYSPGFLNLFENDRFLLTDLMTTQSIPQAILWDKKTNSGVYIQRYTTHYPNLQLFKSTYENSVVCIWNRDAIEAFKQELHSKKIVSYPEIVQETIKNFNEDEDNPILIFFNFKHQ